MATLNWFISRSANRCRPFFLLLHKWKEFEWSEECVVAFQELKQYLSHSPIMSSPVVDEVLFAYIAVALYCSSPICQGALLAVGKGNIGSGPCYKKASPLLPSTHCGRAHSASTQISTQKCRLYWKNCQVGHDPRGFQYKVHASYFYKGTSAR